MLGHKDRDGKMNEATKTVTPSLLSQRPTESKTSHFCNLTYESLTWRMLHALSLSYTILSTQRLIAVFICKGWDWGVFGGLVNVVALSCNSGTECLRLHNRFFRFLGVLRTELLKNNM